MKDLVTYIIEGITGSKDFEVKEEETDGTVNVDVMVNPDVIGLVIGKGGTMVKSIRSLLRVKAALDKKGVFINIQEK